MSTVADFHLHGFDVSHFQPSAPDFTSGGRVFGIMKATEGGAGVDPHFSTNRQHAHDQQLAAVGLYHFARPGSNSAATEAQHFLAAAGARRPGEFAVLDYEVDPWSEGWAATWLHTVKDAGWPVVFYTYRAMLTAHLHATIKSTGAALWCASYSSTPPATGDWPWTFWQHTDGQASVHGNDGPWDCSVFHSNNIDDLAAFVGNQGDDMPLTDDDKKWIHDEVQTVVSDNINWLLGIANHAGTGANLDQRIKDIAAHLGGAGGSGVSADDVVAAIKQQWAK